MRQTITFLLLAVFTAVLTAQTVNIQGDPYGGNPYATITDAITASNDGDVILITGVHTEPISFDKSITLRGTDPTTDIIQAAASASSDGTGSRVISVGEGALTITIENLGIRYGNDANNGGGINVDKVTGLITLKNLIIEDNYTAKNGGGLSFAGTNADVIECTVKNNTSTLDGGGIIAAPNNGAAINCTVNVKQSLVDSNTGRNGGAIYINGNKDFGDDYTIDVNIENSTISNNNATSAGSGAGGGAVWCKVAQYVGATAGLGNINLNLVHATVYNNSHVNLTKSGFRFTGPAGVTTNFSAFNSIIVSFGDDVATKAINFANANLTNMVNCILGGLEGAAGSLAIIDEAAKNNQKGRTANQAGLLGTLSDEGGKTQVITIAESSTADDYCTAATGVAIPAIDQRGYLRESTNDAGAYENGGTLSLSIDEFNRVSVKLFPNPAQEFVKIDGVNSIKELRVYSVLGALEKVVYNQDEIDVSDLARGVHLISILDENNFKITKRLIVK
ncbi:T9SS type A sorting domain-containing protein [Algibacter luteus]|uniref:T9SS type A sorting domain-containing protein n=1 Tax=Algibacter luteus TaxID=1178825 RepID=UPI002599AE9B|nr:T9SS type A sorting domain-containing protein [Algibacter luteus]WJJ95717.1 choice-of-anchor Q domain-containing protein [Algibacter luteus]